MLQNCKKVEERNFVNDVKFYPLFLLRVAAIKKSVNDQKIQTLVKYAIMANP